MRATLVMGTILGTTIVGADILRYRLGNGAKLEIVGICQFVGSKLECRRTDGKLDPKLARQVRSGMVLKVAREFRPVAGKKKRIIVFRETNDYSRGDESIRMGGVATRYGRPESIHVSSENRAGKTIVTFGWGVTMDADDRETALRLIYSKGAPKTYLEAKIGESFQMNGQKFVVESVGRASAEQAKWFGKPSARIWAVRLKISGKAVARSGVYPGLDGSSYSDERGNLTTGAQRNAWRRSHPTGSSPFEFVTMTYQSPSKGLLDLILNADPRRIKGIRFGGAQEQEIVLRGIPLDF